VIQRRLSLQVFLAEVSYEAPSSIRRLRITANPIHCLSRSPVTSLALRYSARNWEAGGSCRQHKDHKYRRHSKK